VPDRYDARTLRWEIRHQSACDEQVCEFIKTNRSDERATALSVDCRAAYRLEHPSRIECSEFSYIKALAQPDGNIQPRVMRVQTQAGFGWIQDEANPGNSSPEISSYASTRTKVEASEEEFLDAIVGHRDAIENGTHRLRDVSLDEDTCCIAYPEATLILSKFFFLTRHHIWYLL
jgi:hypothetical protein